MGYRENRGWELRRIGVGGSAEQGGDEENRGWKIGRIGVGRSGE